MGDIVELKKVREEKEAKFLDIYDLQAKLTGELTEEDSQELLQHPHFMDAFELLMIRNRTNPELNTSVKYWSELMQKRT